MEGIEDTNPTHTPNNPGYGGGLPQQQLAPNPVYVSRQQPTPEALDLMHMGFQMLRHEWPWIKDEDWRATGTVYFTGRDPDTRLTFKVKVRYEGVLRKKPVLYWALFTLQAPWMPQATIGWDAASSEEGECEKGFTLIPTNNQLAPIANVSGVCVWSRLKEALEPNPEVAYGFNTFRQLPHMKDLDLAWFLLPLSSSGTFGWGAAVEWNTSRLSLIIKVTLHSSP
jgi:hypothetical protein